MGKVSYVESPEVLQETVDLFLNDLNKHDQFHGIFQNGRINGNFFSTGFIDMNKRIPLLEIKGSYNLDKGVLAFRLNRTGHYYFLSICWIFFAIIGSYQAVNAPFKLLFMFPLVLGFFGILIYARIYKSRVREFLKTFNHYLNQTKEKLEATRPSKNQNTDPKPPHSIPEE